MQCFYKTKNRVIMLKSKYRAKKTTLDGIKFDSKKEADRYWELKILQKQNKIRNLKLQVPYLIAVNNQNICKYIADFVYDDSQGNSIVEDVKGVATPAYKLKKKLMKAVYGINISEYPPRNPKS